VRCGSSNYAKGDSEAGTWSVFAWCPSAARRRLGKPGPTLNGSSWHLDKQMTGPCLAETCIRPWVTIVPDQGKQAVGRLSPQVRDENDLCNGNTSVRDFSISLN